jgi:phosphatidylglycerophosphatase C
MYKGCETGRMDDQKPPVVAAFDLDGTLTEGGSVFPWLRGSPARAPGARHSRSRSPHRRRDLRSSRWADNAPRSDSSRNCSPASTKRSSGPSRAPSPSRTSNTRVARQLLARLAWHREQGHDVVIVSASPQLYVDVMTELLGARAAGSARASPSTRGAPDRRLPRQELSGTEKLRRLDEWIARATTRSPGRSTPTATRAATDGC